MNIDKEAIRFLCLVGIYIVGVLTGIAYGHATKCDISSLNSNINKTEYEYSVVLSDGTTRQSK